MLVDLELRLEGGFPLLGSPVVVLETVDDYAVGHVLLWCSIGLRSLIRCCDLLLIGDALIVGRRRRVDNMVLSLGLCELLGTLNQRFSFLIVLIALHGLVVLFCVEVLS